MAEDIIVGGVGEIVNRLISLGFDEIGLLLGVKDEVQNLQGVLNNIQAVLQDAEKKQVEQQTLRVWLKDLKQVAYDAEDVLDEIAYEELRCSISNKVSNLFSSSNPLAVRFKIAHKIKDINKRLGAIDKRKNMFKLISASEEPNQNDPSYTDQMNFRETSSLVDDSAVVGREIDKEKIVDMLLNRRSSNSTTSDQETIGSNNITLSVIPIVGLGGLGKTTLAQLVYDDDAVKKHFDLRLWTCVSSNFDTMNLFSQISELIPDSAKCESSSKQALQNNLESQLKGKRFLLVLDDVWNEDSEKWDDFILPFKRFGSGGSKIIITTRSHIVASITGALDVFKIQALSDETCWTLFERRAFMPGGAEKTPKLVEIGMDIVKKYCKGVPLAAKVLGGLMHAKKGESEWLAAQHGEIWNSLSDDENQITKVLKLSYDNLPSTLKSCFSYCAMFPKDYWISRELLIQLWMAQGLLGASTSKGSKLTTEDKGNAYFNILYSKSFFQEAKMNKFGEVAHCKMHDLIHDLAQSVCQSECRVLGESDTTKLDLSKCRHASLVPPTREEALKGAKKLRTIFYCQPDRYSVLLFGAARSSSMFINFQFLRGLDLRDSGYSKSSPSPSRLNLIHLRYLDLSETRISSLPKWVTRLYYLQTLKLEKCLLYKVNLTNLKNLRHLYIDEGAYIHTAPKGMDQLQFLQTLPLVACTDEVGGGFAVLENLNDLRGSLKIYDLGWVKDPRSAQRANLIGKENLVELILDWSWRGEGDTNASVFEELRPNSNLRWLSIDGFYGFQFPRWVSSGVVLPNLVSIRMCSGGGCKQIPSFADLPRLELLEMINMDGLKRIGEEIRASEAMVLSSYRALKKLKLKEMKRLEEWLEDKVMFPCLEEILIEDCPNLRRAPHFFPSLESLTLYNTGGGAVVSITSSLTSLTSLSISNCEDLVFLSEGLLRKNERMENFRVRKCPKFQGFLRSDSEQNDEQVQELIAVKSSLRKLELNYCYDLASILDVRGLTSLEKLKLLDCPKVETIPKGFLSSLFAIKKLRISGCSMLRNIGGDGDENGSGLSFPSLRQIDFWGHYSISVLLEFGKSNDLSFVTRLDIRGIWMLMMLPDELFQCFTNVRELRIEECLNFTGFHLSTTLPCLEKLDVKACRALPLMDLQSFGSLRELSIVECGGLCYLQCLQFLTGLECLRLGPFSEELHHFPLSLGDDDKESNNLLNSLLELEVNGWSTLTSLPHQLRHLTTLKSLRIRQFNGLKALPEWLGNLTSLESLHISLCRNMTSLPSKDQMRRLISLKELYISLCPLLTERCHQDPCGPEWHKLSHIPKLSLF